MSQHAKIWEFFTKTTEDGKATGICKACKKALGMNRGSTSGLRYHLKNAHPNAFSQMVRDETSTKKDKKRAFEDVERAEAEASAEGFSTPKKSRRALFGDDNDDESGITRYQKYASGDRRQLAFDMWTTEYLVESSLPFNHVESAAFKKYIARLQPRALVKAATTFSRNKLPRLYAAMKYALDERLEADLTSCAGLGFTTDLWTSRANDAFLSFTIHYISSDWELQRFALSCMPFSGRHTANRMAVAIDAILLDIPGFSRRDGEMTIVHDAAANMKATIPKSAYDVGSFVCMDHRLQTCLKHAFEAVPELDAIIKKATKLASRCHQSALACEIIRAEAELVETQYVKVVAPVSTRWNSKYLMIESINTIRPALESIRDKKIDIGPKVELFTEEEFALLKELENVLYSFDSASRTLSADKSCTIATVLTALVNLLGFCEVRINNPHEAVGKLASELKKQIETEWPNCGANERLIRISHVLHPYYKGQLLKKFKMYDSTLEEIIDSHPSTSDFRSRAATSEASRDMFDSELLDPADQLLLDLSDKEPNIVEKSPLEIEIAAYMSMPRPQEKGKVDVLTWWREHQTSLPLLAGVARKILAVPASSASSERMFSAAGNIVTAERYNLDPKTTEMLTFCQQNWQKLRCHSWSLDKELEDMVVPAAPPSSPRGSRSSTSSRGSSSSQQAATSSQSQSILPN